MPHRPAPAVLLSLVLLTGCSAGAQDAPGSVAAPSPPPSRTATSAAPTSAAPSSTATPSAAPSPAVRTVDVAYAGGQVTGTTGREEVAVGEQVVLRLTSDVDEEVHVHGYDLEKPLPAGVPVDLPLTATIPGVFEVELHDSGKVLFQLRVS